jgi:hypothetical protein
MSGARDYRPGLAALLDYVREGDTVVVWKLDPARAHRRPGDGRRRLTADGWYREMLCRDGSRRLALVDD